MSYTVNDLQCVLQNEDLLSYVYLAYDDGYFIIGRDEDIGENDDPRLMTLEKDGWQYGTHVLPEAVRYKIDGRTVQFIVAPIKPYTALARLAVLLVLSATRRLV